MAHDAPSAPSSHEHPEPPEDPIQSPPWLPLLGLGLALAGALAVYLFVAPGVLRPASAETTPDGGAQGAEPPSVPANPVPTGAH